MYIHSNIDHIDNDTLNNKIGNLAEISQKENGAKRKGRHRWSKETTKNGLYTSHNKLKNVYYVREYIGGQKYIYLGTFISKIEAEEFINNYKPSDYCALEDAMNLICQ